MIHTELNKGNIGDLLAKRYGLLDNVKIIQSKTLFDVSPNWDELIKHHCPWCGGYMYEIRTAQKRHCKNKKCPRETKFIVPMKKYDEVRGKLILWQQERLERMQKRKDKIKKKEQW